MSAPWIPILTVCLLSAFLFWKQYQRELAHRLERARQMDGHGFEAIDLKARLDDLRKQQQPSKGRQKRQTFAHEEFATNTRKSLIHRSFFAAFPQKPTEDKPTDNSPAKCVS